MLSSGSAPPSEPIQPIGTGTESPLSRVHPEVYPTGRPCRSPVPFFPSRKPPTVIGTRKPLERNPPNARSRQQLPSEKTGRPGAGSASDKTKKLAPQTTRSSDSFCFPDPQRLLCLPRPSCFLRPGYWYCGKRGRHRKMIMVLHSGYALNASFKLIIVVRFLKEGQFHKDVSTR